MKVGKTTRKCWNLHLEKKTLIGLDMWAEGAKLKDTIFIQDNSRPHHPALHNVEALCVCNVIHSDRHAVLYCIWMFGNVNLRQIAWKLEIDLWQYTGLLGTLKKQTPGQAQHFTGSPLTYSLRRSVPEIVKCLEWKEISGHLKCNNVPKQQYQNYFNKWQNQWNNVTQLGGYYCEAKHG